MIQKVTPTKQESSMETVVALLPKAFALFGAVMAVVYGWKYVVGPVLSKGASFVTVAKTDFAALEARVVAVETQVGIVKPSPTGPTGPATAAAPVAVKSA
jgi:hypothetical protein